MNNQQPASGEGDLQEGDHEDELIIQHPCKLGEHVPTTMPCDIVPTAVWDFMIVSDLLTSHLEAAADNNNPVRL